MCQSYEALGKVFVVHLLIKNIDFFFAEKVGTEDVETGTLFGELHATLGAEVLQRDILGEYKKWESIQREYRSMQEYTERTQVVS